MAKPVEERFWEKVEKRGPDECWLWTGNLNDKGYGRFWVREGDYQRAHRMAWRLEFGEEPPRSLDHLCRNRACVNPAHLEAVSLGENVLRGEGVTAKNARKTYCKHGHPLTGDNLYTDPTHGWRHCQTCRRAHRAAHRHRLSLLPALPEETRGEHPNERANEGSN